MSVTTVRLGGRPHQPVLLLGPAAGTSVQALWGASARELAAEFQVVGWDLPGHGSNPQFTDAADSFPGRLTLASLTRDVLEALDRLLDSAPGVRPPPVHYAGHGIGGVVGLMLALDHPSRVDTLALVGCCLTPTGDALAPDPREPDLPDGLAERHPRTAEALRAAADRTRPEAVTAVRRAHAQVDLHGRLGDVDRSLLVVHGSLDRRCDADAASAVVEAWGAGPGSARLEVLDGVAHLAAAETPDRVAALVGDHALGVRPDGADHVDPEPAAGALDARTAALVQVALAAAAPGSAQETGMREVLAACRVAARAGATSAAVQQVLALAWGPGDVDGRLSRKVAHMLEAAR